MAIEFKKERFFPSVRKPGVFLIDVDESTELWEQLTGIDNFAVDKFKFALGSWVEVNNNRQKITLYPTSVIDDESFDEIKSDLVNAIFGDVPQDVFVGLPIISTDSTLQLEKDNLEYLSKDALPLYHIKGSENYGKTSAPLTIQFGVNYFSRQNENVENLVDNTLPAVSLPALGFQSDVDFLNKTQTIFSNFDWYNDTPWKGGAGENAPTNADGDAYDDGRLDDVLTNIEGEDGARERGAWQDSYLRSWHKFEYALPTFIGRDEMTQKYVDARGSDNDVNGAIIHSLGDKIGVSLDSTDPYSNGTADNIDNNFVGVNLEDIIGITKDNMGDAFNPSDYSSTGNMTSKAANVDSTQKPPFIELKRHRRSDEEKVHQLYLRFHSDVHCPLDIRVGDRVAFNIIDRRNETRFGDNTENIFINGDYEHYIHRGRRISRPPLGVGRQFEYTVTGMEFKDGGSGLEQRTVLHAIWLDAFILGYGHLSSGGGTWEVYSSFYTNDVLPGEVNGLSNADIIQIYRPDEDFDEDENSIPSIAHKDKLYLEYKDASNTDALYSVGGNSEKMIRFNTHANNGLALQNTYFKDMPVVDDFMYHNGDANSSEKDRLVENRQGVDALRSANGNHIILYAENESDKQYTKNNQTDSLLKQYSGGTRGTGVYPDDKKNSSNGGSGHIYSDIDRLENLYDSKATISNVSANMEHYSYDFAYYRSNRVRGFGDGLGDKGANAMRVEQRGVISDWIAISSYNSSENRTDIDRSDDESDRLPSNLIAGKNTGGTDLDVGGYTTGFGERNLLSESGKNYRTNLVFQTRRPCDFFIKFRMDKSDDFASSVLPNQMEIFENSEYDDKINLDGYVKISKGKWYQIIPDITVFSAKDCPVLITIGVGAKRKGISERDYLSSYSEVTFELPAGGSSEAAHTRRLGGINKAANGEDIRITNSGMGSGGFNLHLTSKYFTAIQEDELVMPFIRLSFKNGKNLPVDDGNRIFYNIGHVDMIQLPYDFSAGNVPDALNENYVKYHVLDWGDGNEPMTEDKIRQTEFFSIYEDEPDDIDKFQVKNLMQTVEIAKPIYENGILNLTPHTYTKPGVKNIKTLIFKLSKANNAIYETIVMNTSIVVNSVGSLLQDFNAFGASDFNVLPLSNIKKELIIGGGVSSDSNYVSSLQTIDDNNLYEPSDYDEKEYYEDFQNTLLSGSFGDDIDRLDLSTVRFFNKPKSLYDFITDDIDGLINNDLVIENLPINSSATDIFISNDDNCQFELDVSNPSGVLIENTSGGKDNSFGILMGDYSLIKEPGEKIKKEEEMEIPEVELDTSKQAF